MQKSYKLKLWISLQKLNWEDFLWNLSFTFISRIGYKENKMSSIIFEKDPELLWF